MAIAKPRWTYDQLLDLPDDGKRYEIIDGELIELPSPIPAHQLASIRLAALFQRFVEGNSLGLAFAAPFDLVLPTGDVVQPDIVVFLDPPEPLDDLGRSGLMPDLVVEIHSPSTRSGDLDRKRHLYARVGVREYWPVDLRARDITVLVRRSGRFEALPQQPGLAKSEVLPGFEVVLAELFKGFERFVAL